MSEWYRISPHCRPIARSTLPVRDPDSSSSSSDEDLDDVSSGSPPDNASGPEIPVHFSQSRRRRGKLLGIKRSRRKVNDPFDYEQKYPEDREFEEMGPMARIWKTFLDECNKYDIEMVEDWRDGLDVLLVFAGLFSAVVTSFVIQISQSLKLDYNQVAASLSYELINVIRAIAKGMDVDDVPRSLLNPTSPVQPSKTETWVNALWFTSLALSLTTALVAVLTKQWIHQYMSLPSGSPRDRSRIRQFRFDGLKKWRVPVIIGLLPVMMHTSLGLFFAGLVLYVRSLSTSTASMVGGITIMAFLIYFCTNLLPVFHPDCPYKTPLSLYVYALFNYAWFEMSCLRPHNEFEDFRLPQSSHATVTDDDVSSSVEHQQVYRLPTRSLKIVEAEHVEDDADRVDGRALSWLYKISTNASVQSLVLQAISNAPLQIVGSLKEKFPEIDYEIGEVARYYSEPENYSTFERLHRASLRFDGFLSGCSEDKYDSLLTIVNASSAVSFIRHSILHPTKSPSLDILLWTKIFATAMYDRTDWMGMTLGSEAGSTFLRWFMEPHFCGPLSGCDDSKKVVKKIKLGSGPFCLEILDVPRTNECFTFKDALREFALPSMCRFIMDVTGTSRFVADDKRIPSEVRLQLALLRTSWLQKSSKPRDPDETGQYGDLSLMAKGITVIEKYLSQGIEFHDEVTIKQTIASSLWQILRHKSFGDSGVLSLEDRRRLLRCFFLALISDEPIALPVGWGTDVSRAFLHVMFDGDRHSLSSSLIGTVLEYTLTTKDFQSISAFMVAIYTELTHLDWVSLLSDTVTKSLNDPLYLSANDESCVVALEAWENLIQPYARGLGLLRLSSPLDFDKVKTYLQEPTRVLVISRAMALSEVDWPAGPVWSNLFDVCTLELWDKCIDDLSGFVRSQSVIHFSTLRRRLDPNTYIEEAERRLAQLVNRLKVHSATGPLDNSTPSNTVFDTYKGPALRRMWQRWVTLQTNSGPENVQNGVVQSVV